MEINHPAATASAIPHVVSSVSENVRERETYRYDNLSWTSAALNDPNALISPSTLVSAADPSLTSYAQLGVYRLNAARALISLFDRERQHVVTEATRTSPVAPLKLPRPGDNPDYFQPTASHAHGDDSFWLCGTAIPRSFGICEHVLVNDVSSTETTSEAISELPVSVIPDLAIDPRFQDRPYVHGRPFNRFYAGVPIRSPGPNVINIGVYCIFDSRPRPQGLSNDDVKFMQEISRTVTGYLECRASLERFKKSERMVRGMGNFVEGSDSLTSAFGAGGRGSGHSKKKSARLVDVAEVTSERTSKPVLMRPKKPEALSKNMSGGSRLFDDGLLSPCTPNLPTPMTPSGTKDSPFVEPAAGSWIPGHMQSQSIPSFAPDDSSRSSTPRPESAQSEERSPHPAVLSQVSTADLQLVETGQVFSKAANIIRQCLDVDGVLFLDATVRSFGGLVGPQSERKVSSVGIENFNYLSNDEDSTRETPQALSRDTCCPVLGYSTPKVSSINGDRVPSQYEGLRDRTLQRLLNRYPNGRILNFEPNGELLQPSGSLGREQLSPIFPPRRPASPKRAWSQETRFQDELRPDPVDEAERAPTIRRSRSYVAESIIHLFPEARSVVVIPLWDRQKKRWFAGGFAWTKIPTRIFTTDGTLSFLRVFGMIAMAEIYRLDTKAEEKMKSNILGSISHELRSPLHGLVGAVELLNDSKLDAVQQNVVSIIETSGKTLVDTINHLLDYSKINSVIENDKKDNFLGMVGAEATDKIAREKARTPPVELDCLVEEVVESVLAGFSHERLSGARAARDVTEYKKYTDALAGQIRPSAQADRVQIYLDIEPAVSWHYPAHPGAFRRIVMNLFGNSLKFTTSGFIKISLAQSPASRAVLLTVADSGKGISQDYLQNGLFTPFCQEDHFAPGTGLGLSLVRQIAVNLGGEVKVASQVGRGTTITVTLPFSENNEGMDPGTSTGSKQDMIRLKGLKVVIRGFERVPSLESEVDTPGPMTVGRLAASQAHFLENTCRTWLQMEILSEAQAQIDKPDFIIHHDSSLSFEDAEAIGTMAPCPVLFVCEASVAARNFSANLPDATSRIRTFEFFSPPLGPRKLAKGLVHLLDMWKVKQDENEPATEIETMSVSVLPVEKATRTMALDGKHTVVSAEELEVGNGVKLLKSAQTSVVTTQTVEYMASPLPTPPDETKNRDPMAKPETADSNNPEQVPAVLIVDDNAINLKILSAYMKKLNRRHATAVNGLESSTMYAKSPSDYCCILTDISMPMMDGLESARRIRQYERANRLSQTPIIALTGLAGVGVQEDAVASGVDMFLTRPVTLKRLMEALEAVGLQ